MNEQEQKLVDAAKRLLDQSAAELDRDTLSRLARARKRALAAPTGRRFFIRRPVLLTGTAASLATAAAVVMLAFFSPLGRDAADQNLVADMGLLTSEESIEFFEDIEFYEWLSAVDGDEDDLSRVDLDRPLAGHAGFGLGPVGDGADRDSCRDAECRDAGVSRII